MWRARLRRRLCQFNNPNYEPKATEAGFPVDGAHKTKQLLLEAISRGSLDYLLPTFYSKGITAPKTLSLEELQRIKKLEDQKEKEAAYTEEIVAGTRWEEFHFPYYLGKWNAASRRIYYVPNDLMLLLETTSLKGLTFRDIRLPFSSFAIALETPLVVEGEGKELDFFLIGDFSFRCFALYGLARSLAEVKAVDLSLRAKIDEAARRGNTRRFIKLTKKELHRISVITEHWESNIAYDPMSEAEANEDLEEMLSKSEGNSEDHMTKFFRVFVGLCLYLNAFNDSYSDAVKQIPDIKKAYAGAKDGPALTDSAEVCRVQSIVKLTPEETTIIRNQLSGRGGWEVRAHFREGFWRRPRGEGHNPLAKKTIWVRPTLVRRDRLPDGALPLGVGKNVVLS